jgi:FkbM family methyltransferase
MTLKRRLKAAANRVLERCLHHRLEHVALMPTDPAPSLRRLAAKGFQPKQIADVGAAVGEWTREVLPVFGSAAFWLAEPLAENQGALTALAAQNPRVKVWMGAVGDRCGTLSLHVHGNQTSCFSSEWGGEERNVPLATLDALVAGGELAAPDLIKLDVQGAEMQVFEGAGQALARATVLLAEVSFRQVYKGAPLAHEIVAALGSRGFRIYDICSVYKRLGDGDLLQADLLFARPGPWFLPESWNA